MRYRKNTLGVMLPDKSGDHVVLPLDPSQIDDAAVEAMAQADWDHLFGDVADWNASHTLSQSLRDSARRQLAALLAHLAEVE